jgi:hypothetical protein
MILIASLHVFQINILSNDAFAQTATTPNVGGGISVPSSTTSGTTSTVNFPSVHDSSISLSDVAGNSLRQIHLNSSVLLTSTLTNLQNSAQPFTYIVQVEDANDNVVSISSLEGTLSPLASFTPSQSWTPNADGEYRITTFVWSSLSSPIPLSYTTMQKITIPSTSYSDSTFLSDKQKEIINNLSTRSRIPIDIKVWPHAKTISKLDVSIAATAAPPTTIAMKFVDENRLLWNLKSMKQVQIKSISKTKDCQTVVLETVDSNGRPVFNSQLAIGMRDGNIISGISGKISGENVQVTGKTISKAQAKEILSQYIGNPLISLPDPTEVILDPFFLSESEHHAVRGWASALTTITAIAPSAMTDRVASQMLLLAKMQCVILAPRPSVDAENAAEKLRI